MPVYLTSGSGPTVVFISQLGGGADLWKPIQQRLANIATLSYDRPGTGDRPPRPFPDRPISYRILAAELAQVLDDKHVAGPVVLAGHSVGGNIATMFAAGHPDRVAGIVYLDGSVPRLRLWEMADRTRDGDTTDATAIDTIAGEVEILTAETPPVPCVVLTGRPALWSPPVPHPSIDELWLTYQRLLADERAAPLIIADHAGHQLHEDVPDLVAHLIEATHDAARTGHSVLLDKARIEELGGRLHDGGAGPLAR